MKRCSVLLVTTGENCVRNWVERNCADSIVINCIHHTRKEILEAISNVDAHTLITYRCPYIIPAEYFEQIKQRAFNIHPSLLPSYAGLNPWEEMKKARETKGGVTIHRLTSQPDKGEIIIQQSLTLDFNQSIEWNRHNADMLATDIISGILKW